MIIHCTNEYQQKYLKLPPIEEKTQSNAKAKAEKNHNRNYESWWKKKEIRKKLRYHEEEQKAIAAKELSHNIDIMLPNLQDLLNFMQEQMLTHEGNLIAEKTENQQQNPTRKIEDQNQPNDIRTTEDKNKEEWKLLKIQHKVDAEDILAFGYKDQLQSNKEEFRWVLSSYVEPMWITMVTASGNKKNSITIKSYSPQIKRRLSQQAKRTNKRGRHQNIGKVVYT